MVIFRSADGKPGYHQAETLAEAVAFVERLRNDEHVTDARVFRMDEVPIEFKVYYRVEVADAASEAPAADAVAEATTDEPVAATVEPVPASSDGDDAAGANGSGTPGRFGKFSRA
jgi:hypothetical protein